MKFTKNRLLSLLLVLAMMLALVPTVFAVSHTSEHTLSWHVEGEKHVQKCDTAGCDYTPAAGHDPAFDSTYSVGEDGKHYKACTVTGCTIRDSEHTPTGTWAAGEGADANKHVRTCGVCNTVDKHDPAPTGNWLNDKDNHWKACSKCTLHADEAAHDFTTNSVKCSVCNYSKIASVGTVTLTPATVTAAATMPISDASTANDAKATAKSDVTVDPDKLAVTWSSSNTAVAEINQTTRKITAKAIGKTNIVATALDGTTKNQAEFIVKPRTPAFKETTLGTEKISFGQTKTYTLQNPTSADSGTLTYEWYVDSEKQLSTTKVMTTKNTLAAGPHTVTCKVYTTVNEVNSEAATITGTLTVVAPYRVKVSRTYTGTNTVGQVAAYSATLEKYTGASTNDGYAAAEYGTGKDYTSFVIATDNPKVAYNSGSAISINGSTFYLNMYSAGTTSLTATMYQSSTATANIPVVNGSITVSAAEVSPISMNPTTSTYALIDTTTLVNAIYSATNSSSLSKTITTSSIVFNGNGYGTFSTTGSSGSSSYTFTNTSYASSFYFVPSSSYTGFTSPNMYITYTAYSSDGTIATGKIYFTSASSITYSTTASTPVYFKASDFSDYFKTALGGTYNSSYYTLSEVTFGTPRVSNSSVTSGTLYYNNGYVYSTTKVPAANLGYVSYTPSSSTYTYTVSIPFTAYGTYYYGSTATKTVSGTVTIKVNDGHVITMVGTDFKSASIWSDITSKHPGVSYVSFSQPQSTVGKLYYGYSSIASKGSLVSYTDRFNNSNYNYSYANTIKSIDGIYFVPAAGCLDTVTLTYTAYTSATATTGVSDTITFTITKKTASSIFNDVTASNTGKWSADAIDFLARNSIVEGGSYGTFNPNGNMTRGDFVLMLYRMAGKPSVSGISNPFTDVKSTDYYYNAILWAYRNDIVTGVDAKTFAPKKNITREQIAATLYRMAGSPSTSGYLTGYYDYAKIHSYATNAMRWAISNGVITGSNGYLTPTNNATRAQVATMLHRYLTK